MTRVTRLRFLPYATTPGRAVQQAAADLGVAIWVVLWALVGFEVHGALAAIAGVGRTVQGGADGIAGNLDSAGRGAGKVPLVGSPVSAPLRAAGSAAHDISAAGHGLDQRATWLAFVLALAVTVPPVLAVVGPWLFTRVRFARQAAAAVLLARSPAGEQLLALRALTTMPLARLAAISTDPVQAWRDDDRDVVRALAALELRSAGLAAPASWRA